MSGIDKSWMNINNRLDPAYRNGVNNFLDFAFAHTKLGNQIYCPCRKCHNVYPKTREDVEADMVINGIVQNYDFWIFHGEEKFPTIDIIDDDSSEDTNDDDTDDMAGLIADVIGEPNFVAFGSNEGVAQDIDEEPNDNAKRFYRLLRDGETQLYPSCEKFSKLSFIVKLLHIKSLGGWSNNHS